QRHEAALGGVFDDVEDRVPVLVAGCDVEEAELVGAGSVVGSSRLDGIARILQVDEVDALDNAAVLDVEAGDDADLEHCSSAMRWAGRGCRKTRQPLRAMKVRHGFGLDSSASAALASSRPS